MILQLTTVRENFVANEILMIFKNYINSSYVDFLSHNNRYSLIYFSFSSSTFVHHCQTLLCCIIEMCSAPSNTCYELRIFPCVCARVCVHMFYYRKIHKHMDARRYSYSMKAKHGKQLIMTINTQRQLGWRQQLKVAPYSSCLSDLNGGGSK